MKPYLGKNDVKWMRYTCMRACAHVRDYAAAPCHASTATAPHNSSFWNGMLTLCVVRRLGGALLDQNRRHFKCSACSVDVGLRITCFAKVAVRILLIYAPERTQAHSQSCWTALLCEHKLRPVYQTLISKICTGDLSRHSHVSLRFTRFGWHMLFFADGETNHGRPRVPVTPSWHASMRRPGILPEMEMIKRTTAITTRTAATSSFIPGRIKRAIVTKHE